MTVPIMERVNLIQLLKDVQEAGDYAEQSLREFPLSGAHLLVLLADIVMRATGDSVDNRAAFDTILRLLRKLADEEPTDYHGFMAEVRGETVKLAASEEVPNGPQN